MSLALAQRCGARTNHAASRRRTAAPSVPAPAPAASLHPVVQAKLKVGAPNDKFEQEADNVAGQVMRMPEPQLQRTCACGGACPKCQTKKLAQGQDRLQTKHIGPGDLGHTAPPPMVHEVLRSPGQPLEPATRAFMEQRFGHDLSRVRVHADARAAETARAMSAVAYTVGRHVVLGVPGHSPASIEGRLTLAHELAHVVQQGYGSVRPHLVIGEANDAAEHEADRFAEAVVSGGASAGDQALVSQESARVHVQRQHLQSEGDITATKDQPQTPHDKLVVERAKKGLELLKKYVDEYGVREARRLRSTTERDKMLKQRVKMDIEGDDPFAEIAPRSKMEEQRMALLNTLPLDIDVAADQITFRIKFHVRFEDSKLESKFNELKGSVQRGIELVWNQTLKGAAFGGRKFVIKPEVAKVASTATRDLHYWLITVRATDIGPISHPGCTLDQPDPNTPTSVTDSTCDGGVMSIPPSHISMPDILGHELLHLFGFVDRYMMLTHVQPGQKSQVELQSTRATGGRPDPLGAETGTILAEDLVFLFDNLGVYTMEENRGLRTLRQLEGQGMNLGTVAGEIHRLEEIIELGHDPRSLIRIRKDFTDKMIKSAEDL